MGRSPGDRLLYQLEYPKSFEMDSIKAIDDKTAVVIGTTERDANLTFTLFRNNFMILDSPYPFSVISGNWSDHFILVEMEVCYA